MISRVMANSQLHSPTVLKNRKTGTADDGSDGRQPVTPGSKTSIRKTTAVTNTASALTIWYPV